jgi:hypothetical protein
MGVYESEEQKTSGVGHITHCAPLFCSVGVGERVDCVITAGNEQRIA